MKFLEEAKPVGSLEVSKIPTELNDKIKDIIKENDNVVDKLDALFKQYSIAADIDEHNLVVDIGRQVTREIESGVSGVDPIVTFCVGDGGYNTPPQCGEDPQSPLGTDTDLYHQLFSKAISSVTNPNVAAATFITYIDASEWNGYEFSEWGLKRQSGKLYSRKTTKPYPKEDMFGILVKWTIQW